MSHGMVGSGGISESDIVKANVTNQWIRLLSIGTGRIDLALLEEERGMGRQSLWAKTPTRSMIW